MIMRWKIILIYVKRIEVVYHLRGAEYLYDMKLKIDKAFSEYKGVKRRRRKWKKYAMGEAMP